MVDVVMARRVESLFTKSCLGEIFAALFGLSALSTQRYG